MTVLRISSFLLMLFIVSGCDPVKRVQLNGNQEETLNKSNCGTFNVKANYFAYVNYSFQFILLNETKVTVFPKAFFAKAVDSSRITIKTRFNGNLVDTAFSVSSRDNFEVYFQTKSKSFEMFGSKAFMNDSLYCDLEQVKYP